MQLDMLQVLNRLVEYLGMPSLPWWKPTGAEFFFGEDQFPKNEWSEWTGFISLGLPFAEH